MPSHHVVSYLNYALLDLLQQLTTSDRVPLRFLSCKPRLLWGGGLRKADTNPDSTSSLILLPSLAGQGGGPTSENTQTCTYKVGPPLRERGLGRASLPLSPSFGLPPASVLLWVCGDGLLAPGMVLAVRGGYAGCQSVLLCLCGAFCRLTCQ